MIGLSVPFSAPLRAVARWRGVVGARQVLASAALGTACLHWAGACSDAALWVLSVLLVSFLVFIESDLLSDDVKERALSVRVLAVFAFVLLCSSDFILLYHSQTLRANVPLVILAYELFGLCLSLGRRTLRQSRLPRERNVGEKLLVSAGDCLCADLVVQEGEILVEGFGSPVQPRWVCRGMVARAGECCVEGSGTGVVLRATDESLWGRIREALARDARSGGKKDRRRYYRMQGLLLASLSGAILVGACVYALSLGSLAKSLVLTASLSCIWAYPSIIPAAYLMRIRFSEVLARKGVFVRRSELLEELASRRTILFEAPVCEGAIAQVEFRPALVSGEVDGEWVVSACRELLAGVADPFMLGLLEHMPVGRGDSRVANVSLERIFPGAGVLGRVQGETLTVGTKALVRREIQQCDSQLLDGLDGHDLAIFYRGIYCGALSFRRAPFPISRAHTMRLRKWGMLPLLLGMGENSVLKAYGESIGFEPREIFSARTAEQKQEFFLSFQPAITVSAASSKWIREAQLSIAPLDEMVQDLDISAVTILRGGGEQILMLLGTARGLDRFLRGLALFGSLVTVALWLWVCFFEPPVIGIIVVQAVVVAAVYFMCWFLLKRQVEVDRQQTSVKRQLKSLG
jgi:hypothetical protein